MPEASPASSGDRLLWWRAAALASLLLATGLGVGIGLAQAPRPVTFEGGGVTGFPVLKGEIADYGAILATTGNQTITLLRVRLIPVPGYAAPKLVHAVVIRHPSLGSDSGWPPPSLARGVLLPIPGLRVFVSPQPQREEELVYGVTPASSARDYAWAGVDLIYEVGSQQWLRPRSGVNGSGRRLHFDVMPPS